MARLRGFRELTPVDKALENFLQKLQPNRLEGTTIALDQALERVIAKKIAAPTDLPSFNRSAVDGYAVEAKDTVEASPFRPKTFRLVDKASIIKGEAKQIWTGGILPKGADTVVMLEHTKKADDEIQVLTALTPNANVSRRGEDVKRGEVIVEEGVRLKSHHLGLLAALGIDKVDVVKKPTVAILPTGDELVALGQELKPGNVVEVNSLILSGMCTELGAEAFSLGIARDRENEIEAKVREGLVKADIVLTTGGTSVGAHDLVPKVLEEMEPNSIVVHGVAMRPGMPTALAIVKRKPVLVLSGNPVAAIVGFEVFVRPITQSFLGVKQGERMMLRARLTHRVVGVLGRRVFLRVKVVEKDGEFFAEPVSVRGSGILTTMTEANGYVVIPENREGLKENESVTVYLFDYVREE